MQAEGKQGPHHSLLYIQPSLDARQAQTSRLLSLLLQVDRVCGNLCVPLDTETVLEGWEERGLHFFVLTFLFCFILSLHTFLFVVVGVLLLMDKDVI